MLSRSLALRALEPSKKSELMTPESGDSVAVNTDHLVPPTRRTEVSAEVPDWSREACGHSEWNPSRQLLKAIRDYQMAIAADGVAAKVQAKLAVARHRFWSVVCGADIPINTRIGGGLLLPHPNGVVMHPSVSIGPNCLLFQQVTLGVGPRPGFPELGGHVDVGAGAKILGGVKIGDHAVIGANSIVVSDVPSGSSVPALLKY
jgi:serine O-acetyltransferase